MSSGDHQSTRNRSTVDRPGHRGENIGSSSTSRGASSGHASRGARTAQTNDRRRGGDDDGSYTPEDQAATIPLDLLTRILHDFFANPDTRMSREASLAIAKYMDIFVREAIARAKYERDQAAGGGLSGDKFLEVEDLEKLAPQLLLDF